MAALHETHALLTGLKLAALGMLNDDVMLVYIGCDTILQNNICTVLNYTLGLNCRLLPFTYLWKNLF